jgi:hypothetical protein
MQTEEGFQLVPESKCPTCNYTLNAVAERGAPVSSMPQEDDITMCIECYTPLLFNKDLSIRLLNEEEKIALSNLINEMTNNLVFMKRDHK